MKYLPAIAGILLGLMFLMASGLFFLDAFGIYHMKDVPVPPEGSPAALFMGAFGPTGYMFFVKVLELLGAILIAIPCTRRAGLLVLGPIIINILAFHAFVTKGEGLANPMLILIVALTLFLVWVERRSFAAFLRGV